MTKVVFDEDRREVRVIASGVTPNGVLPSGAVFACHSPRTVMSAVTATTTSMARMDAERSPLPGARDASG